METVDDGVGIRIAAARDRISAGPAPSWVNQCTYDREFKGESGEHRTHLLFDRQVNAETRETYVHIALRLETIEAVQHNSQWRLDFEPRTETYLINSLKVIRQGREIDHLQITKGHFLQREEGLNRLVIDGCFTFLLVLDDVRVGDILDWAFTARYQPHLLPNHCVSFFHLPEWVPVGKYHFTLRFNPSRPMHWKSSNPALKPEQVQEDGLTVWKWSAEKYLGLKQEPNTPFWYMSAPWIQVSDCPDWNTVSKAVAEAWLKQEETNGSLSEWVQEIQAAGPELAAKISKALEFVQESCRYSSVNLEFGGLIPTPPAMVARRRYGDCKDLSFLLVHLLRAIGVQARPVLVHAGLRKSVSDLLPTAGSFNHVIVEFEAEGNRRWVDPTLKRQGGGPFNRVVPEFGFGLPIDTSAPELASAPSIPEQSHLFELHETILVDTTRAASLVSMVVRAEGMQAELLRNEFESKGVAQLEKEWLRRCADRFGRATRIGNLKYRDVRAQNQFCTAEVFEINGFLHPHQDRRMCMLRIPSYWINQTFLLPEKDGRRNPFALPHPYQVVHIIDIEATTLEHRSGRLIEPRFSLESPFIRFDRTKKAGHHYLRMTFTVQTRNDYVAVDQLQKHREFVAKLIKESCWDLSIPIGFARVRGGRDFGELPQLVSSTSHPRPAAPPTKAPATTIPVPAQPESVLKENMPQPATPPSHISLASRGVTPEHTFPTREPVRKKRHTHRHTPANLITKVIIAMAGAMAILALIVLLRKIRG